jgi:hypothetical protein
MKKYIHDLPDACTRGDGITCRGKMTISPPSECTTRGSPLDSRHVKGGNVISFSAGYCGPSAQQSELPRQGLDNDRMYEINRCGSGWLYMVQCAMASLPWTRN